MNNILKQRLVGALILLALTVVFWPIIFVPDRAPLSVVEVPVPREPVVDLSPLPEPDDLGIRRGDPAVAPKEDVADVPFPEGVSPGDSGPLPKRGDVTPIPEPERAEEMLGQPALDVDGIPIAYALQVATMNDQERANALRDELVDAGYKGFVKRLRRDDRLMYRVLVGPKFSRGELAPLKVVVDDHWKVESLIIRYLP